MSGARSAAAAWNRVRAQASDGVATIARGRIPHPRDAGARLTVTWPVGQLADYALDGDPGHAPLTIREFPDRWEAFVMAPTLVPNVVALIERNPRAGLYLGSALLGGWVGTSVSSSKESMALGIGLGLLVAALLDDSSRSQ
jgi:hypothetical protein